MQISSAFGNVQGALSYFVDMYSSIAEWQAVVNRLTGFYKHMSSVEAEQPQKDLRRTISTGKELIIKDMEIDLPDGRQLLTGMTVDMKPGVDVLIKGASGSGKSTLLRALAGIWPYVKGELTIPSEDKIMFIPQRPYLPLGTLKESVLYPGTETRTDEELHELMEKCSVGYLYEKLYEEADWSHVLSVGEQQRLAFVRALIYKPVWIFLDEASSALDEVTEAKVYTLLKTECPETTMVSVGHRSTLDKYHQKIFSWTRKRIL
jgi:putative ATP-binding cassette transporter